MGRHLQPMRWAGCSAGRTATARCCSAAGRTRTSRSSDRASRTTPTPGSTTLAEPLPWQNSVLVPELSDLKTDEDLVVMGSGVLVRSLLAAGMIDEFKLLVHPLVLGSGRRLFGAEPVRLDLVDSPATTTGVVIATYRPAR
jgi:riboflavin biosynthesis pyrimidine reductase